MLDDFRSTSITWDKATRRIYSPITANASDSNGRKLNIQVVNSGQVENLTGATLHLYWETKDKAYDGLDAFDASDISKGEFELFYTTGMLSNVGELNATLVLVDSTGKVVSDWFKITVTRGINEGSIESENSFSSLTQALIDISNLEQNYAPRLNDLTAQLQQKVGDGKLASMADLGQDVKEAMTGGSVAVVGPNAVSEVNIVDKQVTERKVSFLNETKGKNLFNKSGVTIGKYYTGGRFWDNVAYAYYETNELIVGNTYNAHDNQSHYLVFFNSQGEVISELSTQNTLDYSFAVPANTVKTIVSVRLTKLDTFQIERGNAFTGYESYGSTFILPSNYIENLDDLTSAVETMSVDSILSETNKATEISEATWTHNARMYMDGNKIIMKPGYTSVDPRIVIDTKFMEVGEKISFRLKVKNLSEKLTSARFNIRPTGQVGNTQGLTKDSENRFLSRVGEWVVVEGSYVFDLPTIDYTIGVVLGVSALTDDEPLMEFDFSDSDSFVAYGDVKYASMNEIVDKIDQMNVPNKQSVSITLPKKVYHVTNDIDKMMGARRYGVPIYANYLLPYKHDLSFADGKKKMIFPDLENNAFSTYTPVNGKVVQTLPVILESDAGQMDVVQNVNNIEVNHTMMSRGVKKAFVLSIGDSVTEWGGGDERLNYWDVANELFEKEAHDKGVENPVTFIGAKTRRNRTVDYDGTQLHVESNAEGRGGHTLNNYLRWTANFFTQATWDACGLGNGSGTDYTGTAAQNTLMRKTVMNEVNPSPANYFFDNDLNGGLGRAYTDPDTGEVRYNKFSLKKYLERYRTTDDNGNRLALGNGTGTLITASNIDRINVCTPTHIVVAMGRNDIGDPGVKGDMDEFHANIKEFTAAVRSEYPNMPIIFTVAHPSIGLWDKSEYPNYLNIPDPIATIPFLENSKLMTDKLGEFEANGLHQLPWYWVTPTAEAYEVTEIKDGTTTYYQPFGGFQWPHPNTKAHWNFGFQLYAFLKNLLAV